MKKYSPLLVNTCGRLLGVDRHSPAEVARADGVSVYAIYKRRRRLERQLGMTLPRPHRIGRPIGGKQ